MVFQKADPYEAMTTRSLLTGSIIGIQVITEIRFPPVTDNLFSCSCMILPDPFSYTNFLRLGTSFDPNGVKSTKPSSLGCELLLAKTVAIYDKSISIGKVSSFLVSTYFFNLSSSAALWASSWVDFYTASFFVASSVTTFHSTFFFSVALFFASTTTFLTLNHILKVDWQPQC